MNDLLTSHATAIVPLAVGGWAQRRYALTPLGRVAVECGLLVAIDALAPAKAHRKSRLAAGLLSVLRAHLSAPRLA